MQQNWWQGSCQIGVYFIFLEVRKLQREKCVVVIIYHEIWSVQHNVNLRGSSSETGPALSQKHLEMEQLALPGTGGQNNPHVSSLCVSEWGDSIGAVGGRGGGSFYWTSHRSCWNLLYVLQICRSWITSSDNFNLKIETLLPKRCVSIFLVPTNSEYQLGELLFLNYVLSWKIWKQLYRKNSAAIFWASTRRNLLNCPLMMVLLQSCHLQELWEEACMAGLELEGPRGYTMLGGEKGSSALLSTKMEVF